MSSDEEAGGAGHAGGRGHGAEGVVVGQAESAVALRHLEPEKVAAAKAVVEPLRESPVVVKEHRVEMVGDECADIGDHLVADVRVRCALLWKRLEQVPAEPADHELGNERPVVRGGHNGVPTRRVSAMIRITWSLCFGR